jgi:hypothetical protein
MKSLCLFSLLCAVVTAMSPVTIAADEKKPEELTVSQRTYYFEHRLLPKWTHGSKGAFFADLCRGDTARIRAAAAEIVGKEFADKLIVRPLPGTQRVLLTFQAPSEPPLCFFAVIEKDGETFHYITLELTEDILGAGTKSVVGEWSVDGGHLNRGGRKYSDADSFLAEVAIKPQGADQSPKAKSAPALTPTVE